MKKDQEVKPEEVKTVTIDLEKVQQAKRLVIRTAVIGAAVLLGVGLISYYIGRETGLAEGESEQLSVLGSETDSSAPAELISDSIG